MSRADNPYTSVDPEEKKDYLIPYDYYFCPGEQNEDSEYAR